MLLNCERSNPAGTCEVTMSSRYIAAAATLSSPFCCPEEAVCFKSASDEAKYAVGVSSSFWACNVSSIELNACRVCAG